MFLYPSKPEIIYDPDKLITVLSSLDKLDNYKVQVKKNGCRAIVWIDQDGKVTIYDRHDSILTISLERDWSPLGDIFGHNTLLDGELIGRKQGEISNRLYLWDMPICQKEVLTQVSYEERYKELVHLFETNGVITHSYVEWEYARFVSVDIGCATSHPAIDWQHLLERIKFTGSTGENEGLVFKNIKHSLDWDSFKTRNIKEQVKFLIKYSK